MSLERRDPVATFYVLAYALSWGTIPRDGFFDPGVLVAALAVVSLTGGVTGLRAIGSRLFRWRVSWVWFTRARAVPLSVTFAALGLNMGLAGSAPAIAKRSVWYNVPVVSAVNIVNPLHRPPAPVDGRNHSRAQAVAS